MKIFILLLSVFVSFNVFSSLNKEVVCFSSDSKKTNVKFVEIYDDGVFLSYVKYNNSKKLIPLLFSMKNEDEVAEGRPAEMTTTWLEVIDGKINGRYVVVSQGARYYSFIYKGKDGINVNFNENLNSYNNDHSDCIWK